jgi:hypothetical protein
MMNQNYKDLINLINYKKINYTDLQQVPLLQTITKQTQIDEIIKIFKSNNLINDNDTIETLLKNIAYKKGFNINIVKKGGYSKSRKQKRTRKANKSKRKQRKSKRVSY